MKRLSVNAPVCTAGAVWAKPLSAGAAVGEAGTP